MDKANVRLGEGVGSTGDGSFGYPREQVLGNKSVLNAINEVRVGQDRLGNLGVIDVCRGVDDHLFKHTETHISSSCKG
jgi:hypothetical protein